MFDLKKIFNRNKRDDKEMEKLIKRDTPLLTSFQSVFEDENEIGFGDKKNRSFKIVKEFEEKEFGGGGYGDDEEKTINSKILPNKKGRFNMEIIWGGVAVGCLLGVMFFYFLIMQPVVLDSYTTTANNKIDEMGADFSSQIDKIIRLQNSIIKNSETGSNLYSNENFENDSRLVSTIDIGFSGLEKEENQKLKNYNIFYHQDVRDIYKSFYNQYQEELTNLKAVSNELKSVPGYLQYRNEWIKGHEKIKDSEGKVSVVKQICQNLRSETNNYNDLETKVVFWNDVKKATDKAFENCKKIEQYNAEYYPEFALWKLDWIDSYFEVIDYSPDYEENAQNLAKAQENLKNISQKSKVRINKFYNSKIEIKDSWYLLGIEL